ncbi:MAG TPA: hypothetical protein VGF95_15630 [Solirubrobacteraceae bacterium]|jgi:hypothetical protein
MSAAHGMDDDRLVGLGTNDADLQEISVSGGAYTHSEVFAYWPVDDRIASGMLYVLVGDSVLAR